MKTKGYSLMIILTLGLALTMPGRVRAAGDSSDTAYTAPVNREFEMAKRYINEKNWNKAVDYLEKALARDPMSAEIQNQLGFAERNRGNIDAAFTHYEKALALDPRHRGAHEYVGEAYLMAGNLAKAEEELGILKKLCGGSCEEYGDLKAAIDEYKKQH